MPLYRNSEHSFAKTPHYIHWFAHQSSSQHQYFLPPFQAASSRLAPSDINVANGDQKTKKTWKIYFFKKQKIDRASCSGHKRGWLVFALFRNEFLCYCTEFINLSHNGSQIETMQGLRGVL
jgi:hypothetical protein